MTARETAACIDIEALPALAPNEVRGGTLATLVSPGTELAHNYLGESFPSRPGYAAVFQAEAWGEEVEGIAAGDLLFCIGPHQDVQQQPADRVVPVPSGLPPERAVLARLMVVSMTTLVTTAARPGDVVLITGAGPVGYLCAQLIHLAHAMAAGLATADENTVLVPPFYGGKTAQVSGISIYRKRASNNIYTAPAHSSGVKSGELISNPATALA
jgi:NADPH:quinone reductase-like Zn-dependent oxidoreductase